MNVLQGEPTLGQIDDYNGNESPQKRKLIWGIVAGLIAVSIAYAYVQANSSLPKDYIGTAQHPGLLNSKVGR